MFKAFTGVTQKTGATPAELLSMNTHRFNPTPSAVEMSRIPRPLASTAQKRKMPTGREGANGEEDRGKETGKRARKPEEEQKKRQTAETVETGVGEKKAKRSRCEQ